MEAQQRAKETAREAANFTEETRNQEKRMITLSRSDVEVLLDLPKSGEEKGWGGELAALRSRAQQGKALQKAIRNSGVMGSLQ